jgi:hypothetical protein
MANKTRKNYKNRAKCSKKGKQLKYIMKTCRAQKYKAIYGSNGGSIRSNAQLYY